MTIGEFSKETGIRPSTLRYYESKGLIRVARDFGNRRDYAPQDVAWVQFLRRLKDTGMPLKDIRVYAELRYAGDSTMAERLQLLERHQAYVESQRLLWDTCAENLQRKIAWYREQLEHMRSYSDTTEFD